MLKCLAKVIVFVLITNTIAFSQHTIQYNLKVNEVFKVSQVTRQDIVQDIKDSKHELTNVLESDFSFKVTAITDSSYIIAFKYDRFKLTSYSNIYGDLITVDTDSINDMDGVEQKIFSGLINSKLSMEMLKTGKIKHITGTEALIDNMVNKAEIDNEFTREVMKEAMQKEFGSNSLENSFEQMTFIHPKKAVNIGDTWRNSFKGKLSSKNQWKLISVSKNIVLESNGSVTFHTDDDANTMTLKGKHETSVTADKTSGFVKSMTVKVTAEGTTVVKQLQDVEMPTKIISTTTYKTTKHVQ